MYFEVNCKQTVIFIMLTTGSINYTCTIFILRETRSAVREWACWKWHLAIFLAPTFWEPEQPLIWYLLASLEKMSLAKHGKLYFILASTCFSPLAKMASVWKKWFPTLSGEQDPVKCTSHQSCLQNEVAIGHLCQLKTDQLFSTRHPWINQQRNLCNYELFGVILKH